MVHHSPPFLVLSTLHFGPLARDDHVSITESTVAQGM